LFYTSDQKEIFELQNLFHFGTIFTCMPNCKIIFTLSVTEVDGNFKPAKSVSLPFLEFLLGGQLYQGYLSDISPLFASKLCLPFEAKCQWFSS
jgi:hypothetical protein